MWALGCPSERLRVSAIAERFGVSMPTINDVLHAASGKERTPNGEPGERDRLTSVKMSSVRAG
jgi:transposase